MYQCSLFLHDCPLKCVKQFTEHKRILLFSSHVSSTSATHSHITLTHTLTHTLTLLHYSLLTPAQEWTQSEQSNVDSWPDLIWYGTTMNHNLSSSLPVSSHLISSHLDSTRLVPSHLVSSRLVSSLTLLVSSRLISSCPVLSHPWSLLKKKKSEIEELRSLEGCPCWRQNKTEVPRSSQWEPLLAMSFFRARDGIWTSGYTIWKQ